MNRILVLFSAFMMQGIFCQVLLGQNHPTVENETVMMSLKDANSGLSIRSCMNSSCHGSTQSDVPGWQRAGRVWFDYDPHAHAYTTLLSEASQRIVERLVGKTPVESLEYQRVLEAKCVSCHSSEHAPHSERSLGADCQVCHGPADAWGEVHYAEATLAKGTHRFEGTRRIDLESLTNRAIVCASCHVGQLNRQGTEREVDHRLMAAGHPTTYFDFGNYLERYPIHWDQTAEDARLGANSAYGIWRTGKLQTAIARVQLLCDRANRNSEWPEFTEYSCTSCHHELAAPAWQPTNSISHENRSSHGRPVWDDWYLNYIELAIEDLAISAAPSEREAAFELHPDEINKLVQRLRQRMEQPFPEADKVVVECQTLLQMLSRATPSAFAPSVVQATPAIDHTRLKKALTELLASDARSFSWERGAQWTITSRAIARTLGLKVSEIGFGNRAHVGFFGTPKIWTLGQPSTFESSEIFQPNILMEYRDSLRSQLESNP